MKSEDVPEGWRIVKIKSIFYLKTGTTPATNQEEYWKDGNINWITPADMNNLMNLEIKKSKRKVTERALKHTNLSVLPIGSIIISTRAPVGYVSLIGSEATFNQGCKGLIPKEKNVCAAFYCYYLISKRRDFSRLSGGSTFLELSKQALEKMNVFYPPIKEQEKIAEILTTVDEAIEETDNIINKCEMIKKGLMQELLTKGIPGRHMDLQNTLIGNIPANWKYISLQNVVKQFIVPMRDKPKRFGGTIPWCRIEDFNGKYLHTSKSNKFVNDDIIDEWGLKVFPKGTVICSCSAKLGVCAIAGNELVTNQTFIGLVVDESKINNEYLYYLMSNYALRLQSLSNGTTIAYLSREEFEKFHVVLPTINEQLEIVNLLDSLYERIQSEMIMKKKLEYAKKSLMQKLLTGQIRVKV